MSNNREKELEEVSEETPVSSDNHEKKEGCVKLSETSFVLCPGFAYAFVVGRKTVIGIDFNHNTNDGFATNVKRIRKPWAQHKRGL